jgi:hypothetical protein
MGDPGGAVIAIVALADTLLSLTEVAVSVTLVGFGIVPGAVYVTATPEALDELDSVPQAVSLQPLPDNVHVTPLLCGSF